MDTTITVGRDALWAGDSGGTGPVAVLLHPGIADARSWDLLWRKLAGSLRLIRYDNRGYGRSPQPTEPYRQLDDLTAVLDHFGLESAHLVGCSIGGANAIDLALASPERVRSLTLLAPGLTGYQWTFDPDQQAAAAAAEEAGEDAVLALSMRTWAAAGSDPFVTEIMRSAVRAWPAEAKFVREADAAVGRLGDIAAPTVLMVGDRDLQALIELDETIAAQIPGCELIRLPGSDHLPALRAPDEVAAVLLRQTGLAT